MSDLLCFLKEKNLDGIGELIVFLKSCSILNRVLFSFGLFSLSSVALADDTDPSENNDKNIFETSNTIIVTATKTQNPENVQDVPLAVTAFNTQSLDALKVRDLQDLSYSAPNVSLDQIGTSRGQANFSIRGLGINSSIPSIDPTVGVFVDGVYLGVNAGVVFDLFDLESVEILRGPQGVLFGRNVTGGAIVINTSKPTEVLSGKFQARIEGPLLESNRGGNSYTFNGVISGPLLEDILRFKIGGYFSKDEGYFSNLFDGANHGEAETKIVRGALEGNFRGLNLLAKIDYFESEGDGPAAQNRGTFDRESFDFSIDSPGFYSNQIWTTSLTATVDIGPGTLTNIFGHRDYEAGTGADIDALPSFIFHSDTDTAQSQISNEVRYAVSMDKFDLTAGGFFFDQSLAYTEIRDLPPFSSSPFYGGGTQKHEVLGLFASSQIHLSDDLSVIAGLRWSRERKAVNITYIRPRPECSVVESTCPVLGTNPFATGENNGFSDAESWSNLSPKLGLQYKIGEAQFYTHWSRGYRSGGYNLRVTSPAAFEAVAKENGSFAFDEEKVDTFEVGAKYQSQDEDFTVNLAAYYTDISDMQREVNQSSATSGVAQSIFNTADASIIGLELEAKFVLSKSLLLTSNLGLIDEDYDKILFDISGDGQIDEADKALRLPRVPEFTWGFGIVHQMFLGGGSITSRLNYQFRDKFAYTDNNFGFIQEVKKLDANVTWQTPREGISFSIFGRNLLDEVQAGGDTQLPFGTGAFSNGLNRPFDPAPAAGTFSPLIKGRQIGVEMQLEF
jgi:iron complex outermembrane receptor protein